MPQNAKKKKLSGLFSIAILPKSSPCMTSHQDMLVMATLRSRCRHYIFARWFLLLAFFLFFFPYLISAVADWMSAILAHMMWP